MGLYFLTGSLLNPHPHCVRISAFFRDRHLSFLQKFDCLCTSHESAGIDEQPSTPQESVDCSRHHPAGQVVRELAIARSGTGCPTLPPQASFKHSTVLCMIIMSRQVSTSEVDRRSLNAADTTPAFAPHITSCHAGGALLHEPLSLRIFAQRR